MQFLKILFWCLVTFVLALFTYGNWGSVPIQLWSGLIADVNLPLLLLVTFLVGFVPTALYYNTVRWRLRQRLAHQDRSLDDMRVAMAAPASPVQPAAITPVAPPAASPAMDPPPADSGRLL